MIDTPLDSDPVGRMGELCFETLCVRAKLIPNRSSWDRTGWDYLVGFPFAQDAGPLDSRASPPEPLVQVKTVGPNGKRIQIRLSAAARLAKHPLAAFICVPVYDGAQNPQALYLLHVVDDLLALILKELRKHRAKNSLKI